MYRLFCSKLHTQDTIVLELYFWKTKIIIDKLPTVHFHCSNFVQYLNYWKSEHRNASMEFERFCFLSDFFSFIMSYCYYYRENVFKDFVWILLGYHLHCKQTVSSMVLLVEEKVSQCFLVAILNVDFSRKYVVFLQSPFVNRASYCHKCYVVKLTSSQTKMFICILSFCISSKRSNICTRVKLCKVVE